MASITNFSETYWSCKSKMSLLTPLEKDIRKLRKKLRQIDHLLHIDRNLNDEELYKVCIRFLKYADDK